MKNYIQDECGVWWHISKKQRTKAGMFICKECGKIFPRIKSCIKNPADCFCTRKCANAETAREHKISRLGDKNVNWKGGRRLDAKGYVVVVKRDHPFSDKHHGLIKEHRLIMENIIGRFLRPEETVHHKNGIKSDNRPENLELWSGNHPSKQRVEDLIIWAKELLSIYEPEALTEPRK